MKNLIIYSGFALVVFANIVSTSFDIKSGDGTSQEERKEVGARKGIKTKLSDEFILNLNKSTTMKASTKLKSRIVDLRNITIPKGNDFAKNEEPIEGVAINKVIKTADELIAEDNLITENNISNETQPLDFEVINGNSQVDEVIESANSNKIEKTADELIAEDNLITDNNISNETQALDFEIINKISKPRN
jgi:hypothetical protein